VVDALRAGRAGAERRRAAARGGAGARAAVWCRAVVRGAARRDRDAAQRGDRVRRHRRDLRLQLDAALASLRASVAPDFADLVPQLALFLLDADGERAGMTPALIVSRLGVTRGQILRAVVPHLDTPEEKLRAQLENLLGAVELDDVRVYLTEQGGASPPDGLVRHLYARSPAGAVQVLRSASGAASAEPASVVEVERVRA
jgi:hypothetical protein